MKLEFDIQVHFYKEGERVEIEDEDQYAQEALEYIRELGHEPETIDVEIAKRNDNLPRLKTVLAHYDISLQFISEDVNLIRSDVSIIFETCGQPNIDFHSKTITYVYEFKGIEFYAMIDDKNYEKRWNQ